MPSLNDPNDPNDNVFVIASFVAVVLSAGWALLLVAAPQLPVAVAGFLYLFGSVICHQISERSFHVDGAQFPVCARCLGIYLGFALGTVKSVMDSRVGRVFSASVKVGSLCDPTSQCWLGGPPSRTAPARPRRSSPEASEGGTPRQAGREGPPYVERERARTWLVMGAAPTMLTVALEWTGLWEPSNIVRVMAGAPLGLAIAVVVTGAVVTLHYEPCALRRPIASSPRTHI